MNPLPPAAPDVPDPGLLTRREALRRTALILGVALSPSIVAGVLRAQTLTAPARGAAKAVHLTATELATAGAVAERILPRTETPGALDAGVPAFIDLMYGEYLTDGEKRVLVAGLAEVEAASKGAHQRAFGELSPALQDQLLQGLAKASQGQETSFFHVIKELTLLGYFTSETVGRNVLHYDPIPGRYDPCVPLADVGNVSWTR